MFDVICVVPREGSKGGGHYERLAVRRQALIVTPARQGGDGDGLRGRVGAGDHGEVGV